MPRQRETLPGRIYKKYNVREDGTKVYQSTWTIRFKRKDYATGTDNYAAAKAQLLKLAGEAAQQRKRTAGGEAELLVRDILPLVIADYKREGKSSLDRVEGIIRLHLEPFFGGRKVHDVTPKLVNAYKDARTVKGAEVATVNRELAILRRAYGLAHDEGTISAIPKIKKSKESNIRIGFVGLEEYRRLYAELPEYVRPILCVAYHIGDRKGELQDMLMSQVDLKHSEIRLDPGTTKNDSGRTAPIYGEMRTVLGEWIKWTKREYPDCPYLFHRDGQPIQATTFRKSWASACERAGLEGLLFHDLRRSAVRNLTRAGVPRPIAMQITGHKTESVYRRYDIVDAADVRMAGALLEHYMTAHDSADTPSSGA